MFFSDVNQSDGGVFGVLRHLSHSYTILPEVVLGWRWGNAVTSLLIPQRGFLLGIPLAAIVFTQWWAAARDTETGERVSRRRKRKALKASWRTESPVTLSPRLLVSPRMLAAGAVAGLLPLIHAHSFIAVMMVGAFLALINLRRWREWFLFFLVASIIAIPQLLWSTHGTAVSTRAFIAWQFGWDRSDENFFWFWLKNTGLFIRC